MSLMHELEKLVHHGLQEFPVRFQESGILSDNVHDITGDDGFVVLSTLHFGKTKEIFDDVDQESLLGLFIHGSGN